MGRGKAGRESEWVKKHQVPMVELFVQDPQAGYGAKEVERPGKWVETTQLGKLL